MLLFLDGLVRVEEPFVIPAFQEPRLPVLAVLVREQPQWGDLFWKWEAE